MGLHVPEPVRVDHVVGVHHGHPLRPGVGELQRLVQGPGLEARQPLPLGEAQAGVITLLHPGGQLFARGRAAGVVVHHDHFEGRPGQGQQRLHGLDHHGRRFIGAGQVHADEGQWRLLVVVRGQGRGCTGRRAGPETVAELEGLREEGGADEGQRRHHQQQAHQVGGGEVVGQRDGQQQHAQRHDGLHGRTEGHAPGQSHGRQRQQQGQAGQPAQGAGHHRLVRGQRVVRHRPGPGELGVAPGVPQAPVGARAAFGDDLPGLVEGFDEVVVQPQALGLLQELPHEQGLVGGGGFRFAQRRAVARPADLADDHLVFGEARLHTRDLLQAGLHGLVDGGLFPVGQHVDGDEVHMLGQLWLRQPDVPGLGRRHLDRGAQQGRTHFVQVGDEPVGRQLGLELGLVAHHHAVHVGLRARQFDGCGQLSPVGVEPVVQPHAQRHLQAVRARQRRQLGVIGG